jgi:predicted metal-dependent phosphoesterase TrpH
MNGLDAIAITDHDTIKGSVQARRISRDKLTVITGSEIKTESGDIIGLFLQDEIVTRDFSEVLDEIKRQDAISILPHPFRRKHFPDVRSLRRMDYFEGLNGRTDRRLNNKAQTLARELMIPIIAGSDAHFSYELGKIKNCVDIGNSEEEIRKHLKKNQIVIKGDSLPFILRKGSMIMGNTLKILNRRLLCQC